MRNVLTTVFILFLMIMLVACSPNKPANEQGIHLYISKSDGQDFSMEKRMGDNETVNKVLDILQQVAWDNAIVSMSRQPDYKIRTEHTDPTVSYESVTYDIWLAPDKNSLEVVIEGQSKYGKVSKENSKVLFSLLGIQ